jgi:pyruvate dehydrogenase E1 component
VIVDHGMREMVSEQKDVFYYITLMNENYSQPSLPEGVEADIIKGCYHFKNVKAPSTQKNSPRVTLMGSGAILTEVIKASEILASKGVSSDVLSVTSWSELARQGRQAQENSKNKINTSKAHIHQCLSKTKGPVIAASDYVLAVTESVRAFLPQGRSYHTLGTDGFGRSDTRAALRDYFKVSAEHIADTALNALQNEPSPP